MSHELPHQLEARGEGHARHLVSRGGPVSAARVHRRRADIALAVSFAALPGAIVVGGFNGLTAVGVIAVSLSIASYATAERRAS